MKVWLMHYFSPAIPFFFSFSGPSLAHYSECCGDYLWNSASNYVNGGASLPTTTFALIL